MRRDRDVDDEDDEEGEDERPRSRGRSRAEQPVRRWWPLRFVTPGTFGAAIILFFLPWTDLSCNGPTGKMEIATQSAYESAVGEVSEGDGLGQLRADLGPLGGKKTDGKLDLKELQKQELGPDSRGPDKAPLLWLYLALLAGGAIVPVLVAATQIRGVVVFLFAAFASLLLILQLVLGFPLANTANDFNKDAQRAAENRRNVPGQGPNLGKMEMKASYKPAFWGTVVLLVASLALGGVQVAIGTVEERERKRSTARTRRRSRDDDDDDENDE